MPIASPSSLRTRPGLIAGEVLLEQHRDRDGALGDGQQVAHRGLLLDLLLEEPLHELLARVVARLAGDLEQLGDLDGHLALLLEREADRLDMVAEGPARRADGADVRL